MWPRLRWLCLAHGPAGHRHHPGPGRRRGRSAQRGRHLRPGLRHLRPGLRHLRPGLWHMSARVVAPQHRQGRGDDDASRAVISDRTYSPVGSTTFATTPPFRQPIRSASTRLSIPPRASRHSASIPSVLDGPAVSAHLSTRPAPGRTRGLFHGQGHLRSVGVGMSSRAVRCGPCAGWAHLPRMRHIFNHAGL
jgi:hypothetical protein